MRGTTTAFPSYSQYSNAHLLDAYCKGPARIASSIAGLDEHSLLSRPRGQDTWSAQEIVMHLADSEIQGLYRVRKILAEPGALLPGYDQAAWTKMLNHQCAGSEGRSSALTLFRELRIALEPHFTDVNLAKNEHGFHPEYGPLTIRHLLELYADHSERHLDQILTIRRLLGVPLDIPLLLPERLY